ncbi:hypothetical protein MMC12_007003 [Toensbergia leucococca]|nr:hypothetical protein [Toensbergia leucococca]
MSTHRPSFPRSGCCLCGVALKVKPNDNYTYLTAADLAWTYEIIVLQNRNRTKCHQACWRLMQQEHPWLNETLLAKTLDGNHGSLNFPRDMNPDWCDRFDEPDHFNGPLDLWSIWGWNSGFNHDVDHKTDFGYLVRDPFNVSMLQNILVECYQTIGPHEEQSVGGLQVDLSASFDVFQQLPPELILRVMSFLPSPSVGALRLASRTCGMLSLRGFWKTRFFYPHELCHIPYATPNVDVSDVQWTKIRHSLLYPFIVPDQLRNRFRISYNNKRLAGLIKRRQQEQREFQDFSIEPIGEWTSRPSIRVERTQRTIVDNYEAFRQTSRVVASFVVRDRDFFVSGIRLEAPGSSIHIGTFGCDHHQDTQAIEISQGLELTGFILNMEQFGISGLQLLTSDKNGKNTVPSELKLGSASPYKKEVLPPTGAKSGVLCTQIAADDRIIWLELADETA